MGDPGSAGGAGFDWEGTEDFTALSRRDLASMLEALCEEERALGYRQQVLRGRIELIRAELSGRSPAALSPEELARVLLGEEAPAGRGSAAGPTKEEAP